MEPPPRYESAPQEQPPSYTRIIFDQVVTDQPPNTTNTPSREHIGYLNPISMTVSSTDISPPPYRKTNTPNNSTTMEPLRPLYRGTTQSYQASSSTTSTAIPNHTSTFSNASNASHNSHIPTRRHSTRNTTEQTPTNQPTRRWPTVATSTHPIRIRNPNPQSHRYQTGGALPFHTPNGANYFYISSCDPNIPFHGRCIREYHHGINDAELRAVILKDILRAKDSESRRMKKQEQKRYQDIVVFVVVNIFLVGLVMIVLGLVYARLVYQDQVPRWLRDVPVEQRPGFVTWMRMMYLEHRREGRDYTEIYEQRYPGFRTVVV
ncbi:hypothetical protein BZA77DRAFT_295571 [Pyronema omphalodes]|nr:hypothetical protein BZA77DRAFT_295571 [Pyronema omphalodes]